jgi:endonuclease/exonuclease/phosphatase family metal-dependent hydrolase
LNPDLIGTQEGVYHQLRDIAADLPEYDWIGLGRDGGSRGEFMAVYYRKDRFEPLEYDHFWLSDTPEVIASVTWGHSNRRMVTWVRFLDNQTGREFYFFNTHFDHAVQPAREKSAELVLERVRALKTDLPIILLGDFNAAAGDNKVFDLLVNDNAFVDSWDTAKKRVNPDLNTFNGFRPGPHTGGRRIDWILYRGPFVVDKTGIYDYAQNGQFPSDHFPVVAWMRLE